jgi:hypothetical protein
MRQRKWIAAMCAVVLAGTIAGETGTTVQAARPSVCSAEEWEVLRLTNEKRIGEGEEPVSTFGDLQKVCTVRGKEISQSFSHTRPNGESCFTALGSMYGMTFGENIAAGQTTAASAVTSWWNSAGHKANMLNTDFDHMGVGYYKTNSGYRYYWVQMFVGGCTFKKISVNSPKKVISYKKGTTIKKMKRYVKVSCEQHGTSYLPLAPKMCSGYNGNKTGTQKITVKYKGLKTSFTVNVTN